MADTVAVSVPVAARPNPDYGHAISWVFSDPKFGENLLIMSVLVLSCILVLPILFVGPFLAGYAIALTRNIQQGNYVLPARDYGAQWTEGILYTLVLAGIELVIFLVFLFIDMVITLVIKDSTVQNVVIMFFGLINYAISFFLTWASFQMVAIIAKTRSISSLFNFSNYSVLWNRNGATTILAMLLYSLLAGLAGILGFALVCVGILPAVAISTMWQGSFAGLLDTEGVV